MIELDDRLCALRALGTEWAGQLRATALDLDRDPSAIAGFLTEPVVRFLATARYASTDGAEPIQAGRYRYFADTALEQAVLFEELARGDLGAIMASPGAPMAGAIVQLLGDENQRREFFGQLDEQPTWTFLALTEPGQGSDAANMATSLTQDGDRFLLTGAKRYVGNATRAGPGVVFARTGPGPLGVRAVLVPALSAGFTATALSTIGLRAALLAAIEMDAVEIAPEWLLGRHLSSTRRGIWSWVQTFNRIRPRVAAMGLGLARAAYDYVVAKLPAPRSRDADRLAELGLRIDAVRQLIWHAAAAVDADPANGHLPSAAKAQAARLAEDATLTATELLGPAARLEHPLLDKLVRDARGVEFMEGAGHLQRLAIAQQLTRQKSRALYHNDIGISPQFTLMPRMVIGDPLSTDTANRDKDDGTSGSSRRIVLSMESMTYGVAPSGTSLSVDDAIIYFNNLSCDVNLPVSVSKYIGNVGWQVVATGTGTIIYNCTGGRSLYTTSVTTKEGQPAFYCG